MNKGIGTSTTTMEVDEHPSYFQRETMGEGKKGSRLGVGHGSGVS